MKQHGWILSLYSHVHSRSHTYVWACYEKIRTQDMNTKKTCFIHLKARHTHTQMAQTTGYSSHQNRMEKKDFIVISYFFSGPCFFVLIKPTDILFHSILANTLVRFLILLKKHFLEITREKLWWNFFCLSMNPYLHAVF